jgi:hypothetical protein
MTRRARAAALAAVLSTAAAPAHADDGSSATLAEVLFREGLKLFDAGSTHEACTKFAESYRLDAANGTLQNLAACHEKEGRSATAWTEWSTLATNARRAGQKPRESLARTRGAALEQTLSYLVLESSPAANVARIEVDGVELGPGGWSLPLPLDPGEHHVTFRATGHRDATRTIAIPPGPARTTLPIPRLDPEPLSPPIDAAVPAPPPPASASPVREAGSHGQRTVAVVLGAAGVLALGAGAYFGIRTFDAKADGDALCVAGGRLCPQEGLDRHADAESSATISTIAFAGGVLALGIAAVLYLTAPRNAAAATSALREPWGGARLR